MTPLVRSILFVIGATAMIAVSAQLSIDIEPVPLTLQTAALFIIGLLLPIKCAALSVLLYLIMGVVGFPIFADGRSGLSVLLGPTGGFLFGFLIVTTLISYQTRNFQYKTKGIGYAQLYWRAVWPCIVATILLQIIGIVWGKINTGSSWPDMYTYWLTPFYLNMILKILLSSVIAAHIWMRFSRD